MEDENFPLTPHRAFVHSLAHVARTARLGDETVVWQFASIIRHAVVGAHCKIASCVIIDGARIGNHTSVGHGAFIGPGTLVEDEVFIGPNATLCNDAWPAVSKDGFDLDKLISGEVVTIRVEDGASVGAGAIILPGVIIGAEAVIAAGAIVDRSVPHGCLFKRGGEIVKLDPTRSLRRMREV